MREIKFKLWDEKLNKMGFPFSVVNILSIKNQKEYSEAIKSCKWLQYIGCQDINGKDIYEGDIVNSCLGELTEIVYCNYSAAFQLEGRGVRYPIYPNAWSLEIVGNKHERY